MKDPRKEAFGIYLRALADLVGLRDWHVGVEDAIPDPEHLAECNARHGRKIVWVRLSEAFLDSAPDRQRQTLVHELLHAHTAHLEHLMHGELTDPGERAFMLALEYAVDGIAEEWAKHLPLPDDVKPRPERRTMAMPKKNAAGKFVKPDAKAPAKGKAPAAKGGKAKAKGK